MPLPKTVTAQDFIDGIYDCSTDEQTFCVGKEETINTFDALLSRVRQEARREALKEMDEAHIASEKAYQAFRMNGRCEPWASEGVKAQNVVIKLRQEYQQP